MKKNKKEAIYAFIDSQNLNLGVRSAGWVLDFRKFFQYLTTKYRARKVYLFIGYKPGNEKLYTNLQQMGYVLVFKPTMELPDGEVKGNVDAELVLHTMIEYPNYDGAIIVSNDGDFHCLVEYLNDQGKLYKIMAPNKYYSSLLRKYNKFIVRIDLLKKSLVLEKAKISGRSKP